MAIAYIFLSDWFHGKSHFYVLPGDWWVRTESDREIFKFNLGLKTNDMPKLGSFGDRNCVPLRNNSGWIDFGVLPKKDYYRLPKEKQYVTKIII